MDKLIRFNAEFEVVDGQRGAIIMINDKIVGIEIAPTHDYWKTVWNSLVRDCYGSEVIRLTMLNLIEEFKTSQELDMDISNCQSIATKIKDLDTTLEALEVPKYNNIIQENSYGNLSYHIVKAKNTDIYGEVYCDKNQMIYCSVLF